MISGVHVAAVTPHRKQGHEADFGAVLELIDFLSSSGVHGIALLGSTGEFLHLKFDDRVRLVYLAVKRSRVPIIAGVSHSTLDGAVELAREASSAGAAAVLVMPPYFFRYSQEDICEFYLQFASQFGRALPVYLYNIPLFTNEISAEAAAGLLSTGGFAGIKDSSGQVEYIERLIALRPSVPVSILVGNDAVFARCRRLGADGLVSGVACAVPELLLALDRAIRKSDEAAAGRLDGRLHEFLQWIDRFPAPVAIKVATAARGLKVGPLAVPLSAGSGRLLAEFQEWFRSWLPQVRKEAGDA